MSRTLAPGSPAATGLERSFADVLAGVLDVGEVSVDGHFFDELGADSMLMARFCARVRKRADLPSASMRDVYAHPTVRGLAGALQPEGNPLEAAFAELLAGVLDVGEVSVDGHFFDDLGADSMLMARFCARVRKRPDLPSVSMKDVYRYPTVSSLAAASTGPPTSPPVEVAAPIGTAAPTSSAQYLLCGALQFLCFVGYVYLVALVTTWSYEWVSAGSGLLELYGRAVVAGGAGFVGACLLPVLAKWVLIGRWTPGRIQIWSLAYVRFWIVKTLVRSNPLLLVAGGRSHTSGSSPLYVLYLRALGAKIGRNVAIFSRNMPVCTDLLTIGDGSVIRKDALFSGYHAQAGEIYIGAITLGRNAVVGEITVLDINTSLGDGAQLGHASSLHIGQSVPAGERWHGSPGQPTDVDYRTVEPARCGAVRRTTHAVMQLLAALLVYLPLTMSTAFYVLADFPLLSGLDTAPLAFTTWTFYRDAVIVSAVLFLGFVVGALLVVLTVPRLLNLAIRPDRVYPLYGFHYSVHRAIGRLTNVKFFTYLFGDSSYIVHYLRALGYDLSIVEQTGSNFGTDVRHETPFQVSVGRGTMVADGLSIINADFSNTSFRVSRVSIGAHSFLGNRIAYPARSRIGENCLLATKVLIPTAGPVRRDVGLLGAPSFPIPRTVDRDAQLGPRSPATRRRRLRAKNRYNRRTIALALFVRWLHVLGLTLLGMSAADYYRMAGAGAVAAELVLATLFTAAYFVLVERSAVRFRALRPRFCSIYHPYFWWHERFWKLVIPPFDRMLAGTPFKNVVSRLLGVRIGRGVFDDGAFMTERTLVDIGDHCTLNAEAVIQCHSQEDGHFKSDRTTIGAGCTLGVAAFVHYGVDLGDGAVLDSGSFLMKGEEVPPRTRWGGNPAGELQAPAPAGSVMQVATPR
jgi:non-ribosomal peptide synthetase-like protein